ncbi:MAG TPA: isopeptide-forming domain-containing fimbrial protein [Planctomycetaceae bacterium]|nr:isopeptide-forming domain-containing fimbrial protein [Planctomycetaceae bacterium]
MPIHYGPFNRLGVDTEDTVAEYTDHTGKRHVKATNRVAIYAPRFAALRTVCVVGAGTAVTHLAGAHVLERNSGLSVRQAPTLSQEHVPLGVVRVRSRASGLERERLAVTVANEQRLSGHTRLLNAFEDVAFLWTGQFDRTNEARLAYGIAAAFRWSRTDYPVITAADRSSHEVSSRFKPEVLISISDEHKRQGELRIVKLADKKVAKPGDIVTFTIRYDNLGDRTLYHVRIVDNLTPRLEFIEDSATSDRAGDVKITDNEEGSVVLEFTLDAPLPGHTGGVITFQTRVR